MKEKEIRIERIFNAPRKSVWEAWTDPEIVKKWWGPKGFTSPSAKIDLKVGGKYIFSMHGPKGTEFDKDLYSAGIYQEIIPMEKLVVSDYFSDEKGDKIDPSSVGMDPDMPDEMRATVKFQEEPHGKTRLTILYPIPGSKTQFEAMQNSGMIEGWNSTLDKLADFLKIKQE
jgi:uncharacterized protein YndB with AHSA1/START domain